MVSELVDWEETIAFHIVKDVSEWLSVTILQVMGLPHSFALVLVVENDLLKDLLVKVLGWQLFVLHGELVEHLGGHEVCKFDLAEASNVLEQYESTFDPVE